MLCLIYHKKQTGSFTICKAKKQVVTEKILAYVKRSAEKNAGIPSSKGMCEPKVPDKLKERRDNRN